MFDQQVVSQEAISGMDELIDDRTWSKVEPQLKAVCRFCSVILCAAAPTYFDLVDFNQYLCEQTAMSHSTIREYVVRLRRLDDMLAERHYPNDTLDEHELTDILEQQIPDAKQSQYRSVLRKYVHYLKWAANP